MDRKEKKKHDNKEELPEISPEELIEMQFDNITHNLGIIEELEFDDSDQLKMNGATLITILTTVLTLTNNIRNITEVFIGEYSKRSSSMLKKLDNIEKELKKIKK